MDRSTDVAGYTGVSVVTTTGGGHVFEFERITTDSAQMGGLPCVRGLRITVAAIIEMVAEGMTVATILENYPDLEPEDIEQALRYAAEAVRERELPLRAVS